MTQRPFLRALLSLSWCCCVPSWLAGQQPVTVSAPNQGRSEAIWLVILQAYAAHTVRSEGDITLQANRLTGYGEQRAQAAVALFAPQGGAAVSYRQTWLDSLVGQHVVLTVCKADTPNNCPGEVMTSFLTLSEPQVSADTAATVQVGDQALNPRTCRTHNMPGTGGFMRVTVQLALVSGVWQIVAGRMEEGGTNIC